METDLDREEREWAEEADRIACAPFEEIDGVEHAIGVAPDGEEGDGPAVSRRGEQKRGLDADRYH